MITGLEQVEFTRFGQMHRNTCVFSPLLLSPTLQFRFREDLLFAGQITDVEGYANNIVPSLLAGINAENYLKGKPLIDFSQNTMIGAHCYCITYADDKDFQPMKAKYKILPNMSIEMKGKQMRAIAYAEHSVSTIKASIDELIIE
jgi:methylenetetrahydrofolate--tRNA-(uracil-5-)-methyltransferase